MEGSNIGSQVMKDDYSSESLENKSQDTVRTKLKYEDLVLQKGRYDTH